MLLTYCKQFAIIFVMKNILKQLKAKGYRRTQPRKLVLEALSFHPQSVADIVALIKKRGVNIDITTVYRTLEILVDLGIVAKTTFTNQTTLFELLAENNHHHHLVCNDCGLIEDVSLDEAELMKQVCKQTKFKIYSHSLEFFGLCAKCQ